MNIFKYKDISYYPNVDKQEYLDEQGFHILKLKTYFRLENNGKYYVILFTESMRFEKIDNYKLFNAIQSFHKHIYNYLHCFKFPDKIDISDLGKYGIKEDSLQISEKERISKINSYG